MKALEKNKTWSATTIPMVNRTMACKWACTIKYNCFGWNGRYNVWLVSKGVTITYGINYSENFAHVAKLNTIRIFLSLVANLRVASPPSTCKKYFPQCRLRRRSTCGLSSRFWRNTLGHKCV